MTRPTLRTERLELRPLTPRHTDLLVDLDADPRVMRFLTGVAGTRADVVEIWMPRRTDASHDRRGLGYWVGFADGDFVGWFCLTPVLVDPGTAELGYRLRRAAWGHGYAEEGARAVVRHGFATVGLDTVVARTMAVNHASRRVMERLAMRHTSTEVQEWDRPIPGWEEGEVRYELTSEELLA